MDMNVTQGTVATSLQRGAVVAAGTRPAWQLHRGGRQKLSLTIEGRTFASIGPANIELSARGARLIVPISSGKIVATFQYGRCWTPQGIQPYIVSLMMPNGSTLNGCAAIGPTLKRRSSPAVGRVTDGSTGAANSSMP